MKACKCGTPQHHVVNRRCNYSAFNGYHRTPSRYSGLVCLNCGAMWRTKAKYVDRLPDAPPEWWNARIFTR